MSSSTASLEKFRIPLKEIVWATNNFSLETKIGDGGFGSVHKGQLSEQWQNRMVAIKRLNPDGYQGSKEFHNELEMVASFDHPNIINFIGFCDDANQMIIVYDYAVNGSLDHRLQDPEIMKRRCLTWEQRLKLCLGVAKGLEYLHSGLGEHKRVIHRDVKSANILLDENWDAKICDFGLSRFGARNQENTQLLTNAAGTRFYMDPVYAERSRLTKESDVYSFGVVMFEISSGALAYHRRCFGSYAKPQYLIDLVRSYYDDDAERATGLDNLIDPLIRGYVDKRSVDMFNSIAHECINLNLKQRPTMEQIIRNIKEALDIQLVYQKFSSISTQSLENFVIPLEEIKLATQCFSKEKHVGVTVCCDVYKGQLSKLWPNPMAIKRLYPPCYRGEHKFNKELQMMYSFHHQNILQFIGYCDEVRERIVVHEYALNGSLSDHLGDSVKRGSLSWAQRLKICIGAAEGLRYLQSRIGEDNEIIRGKFNSTNIMLDENMEAKVSFFELSKQNDSIDKPEKSDMFSLGVLLLEVLSGCLSFRYILWGNFDSERNGLHIFTEKYRTGQIEKLIDGSISKQIDSRCYYLLKEIVYQCIITDNSLTQDGVRSIFESDNQEARPSIDTVIESLQHASNFQEREDSSSYRRMSQLPSVLPSKSRGWSWRRLLMKKRSG